MNIVKIQTNDIEIEYDECKRIKFELDDNGNIDKYISKEILPQLNSDIDCILIEIQLSENLLDLNGLRLLCHIRLSFELNKIRYVPIVLISDFDGCEINIMDTSGLANIIFTSNIYLSLNETENIVVAIEKALEKRESLNIDNLKQEFLEKLHIEAPQNKHSIANEWAMYQWSSLLELTTKSIKKNTNKVSSMLYFKYLIAKYHLQLNYKSRIKQIDSEGRVLLIDDKWNDGWKDIMESFIYQKYTKIKLETLEYDFEKYSIVDLKKIFELKINKIQPDVVLLDLRLFDSDNVLEVSEKKSINKLSGIQIINEIKKINPGIQIVMFTASGDSLILDELYNKGILGYVKKDAPSDKYETSKNSFTKLDTLIKKGIKRSYLIEIWEIEKKILNLNLFKADDVLMNEIVNTIPQVFKILNSNIEKPFLYAMYTIFKCIELICDYYIDINYKVAYWKGMEKKIAYERGEKSNTSIENKIVNILKYKLKIINLEDEITKIVCSRNYAIHAGEINFHCEDNVITNLKEENILVWFEMLYSILSNIKK